MQTIIAKVQLNLPNQLFNLSLKYDTYEPASFDRYLIASLVKNSKNEKEAIDYIKDITGKGSLNGHFQKLYKKISQLKGSQINDILNDSLYPITKIDNSHSFEFFPILNVSRFNKKTYEGNLISNKNLKDMIMPNDDGIKFLSLDHTKKDVSEYKDRFDVKFSNNSIEINLGDGKYWEISKRHFNLIYESDITSSLINEYKGKIGDTISEGQWMVLTSSILNSIKNKVNSYYDKDGNFCEINSEFVKKIEIIKVFSLYFYKESRIEYTPEDKNTCEKVLETLLSNGRINEFKTKFLLLLLECVDDLLAQKVIHYILQRKDSKEIAEFGVKLIKRGVQKGWTTDVLKSIKKLVNETQYTYLYKIDNNLDFEIEDLLYIDDIELSENDKARKVAYLNKKENMLSEIKKILGEISASGVREKMKKLKTKTEHYTYLNKFINNYLAHNKVDFTKLSMKELETKYDECKRIYANSYQKILESCNKLEQ